MYESVLIHTGSPAIPLLLPASYSSRLYLPHQRFYNQNYLLTCLLWTLGPRLPLWVNSGYIFTLCTLLLEGLPFTYTLCTGNVTHKKIQSYLSFLGILNIKIFLHVIHNS
jgi:hypothetical protein